MRGDGPVGEAQYRRGPLLGRQVAEGREESPQLRCPRPQIRGLRRQFCRLYRQLRRQYRQLRRQYRQLRRLYRQLRRITGCSAGPTGSPAANSLMRPWA